MHRGSDQPDEPDREQEQEGSWPGLDRAPRRGKSRLFTTWLQRGSWGPSWEDAERVVFGRELRRLTQGLDFFLDLPATR